MAKMTVRSTYALDRQTAQNIERLARSWDVSRAEVIRRSVRMAAELKLDSGLSPAEAVARYAQQPLPRSRTETHRLIASMRKQRHEDDTRRVKHTGP